LRIGSDGTLEGRDSDARGNSLDYSAMTRLWRGSDERTLSNEIRRGVPRDPDRARRKALTELPTTATLTLCEHLGRGGVVKITTDLEDLRRALVAQSTAPVRGRNFHTRLNAFDAIAPNGAFQGGAVHELLWPGRHTFPTSIALLLAQAAQSNGGAIAWSDPERELHLPAVAAAGISLRHLILLRCTNRADQLWALAECLRCRGISATVASIEHLNQIEARRLQLAAERGGGVGIFIRPQTPGVSGCYAAATRWLIQTAPGSDQVQRWSVELLHGHGGQIGKVLLLEVNRETRALCASTPLANRPTAPAAARAAG
jgi:protein ImuA